MAELLSNGSAFIWRLDMLREYLWNGSTWQFEETEAPASAVLLNKENNQIENKELKPKTKTTRTHRTVKKNVK